MRPIVRIRWLTFTEPLEGGVSCLYNDRRGLTTIAYGNLCNTAADATALALVHPDGTPATAAEKVAAWRAVHDDPECAERGWKYAATLTKLRMTREGMDHLALAKLENNDRILLARLPMWEELPACAQMALHSLAWACGANAHFPRLFADVSARNFEFAAVEIHMNEWTPEGIFNAGLVPRNRANKILMRNAGRVQAFGLDPDMLDWKHDLSVADEPTLPELPYIGNTPLPDSRPPPANAASSPTMTPQPILHVQPGMYFLEKDPDDPDEAA